MKIYLAGGMHGSTGQRIRNAICRDVEWLDPASWQDEYPSPEEYTQRDLAAIVEADVVIAFMTPDNPSGYGMSLEVGYAHALGKMIVFLDELGEDWRSRYFGMVRSVADVVVKDVAKIDGVLP